MNCFLRSLITCVRSSTHFHLPRMTPIVAKKVIDDEVVTYSAYLASGNTQTCTAQGFIYILSLRLWNSYYAALMILYWFIVHYGWKENRMNIPRLTNFIHSATDHNRPWTCHPTTLFGNVRLSRKVRMRDMRFPVWLYSIR